MAGTPGSESKASPFVSTDPASLAVEAAISAPSWGSFTLENRVAIVTGAGSGIGRAIATLFARKGARVMVLDVNVDGGHETVELCNKEDTGGGKIPPPAEFHSADVTKSDDIDAVFDGIRERHGSIDILVNNAGIASIGTCLTTSDSDLDRVMAVNVKGVANCLRAAVRNMLAQSEESSSAGGAEGAPVPPGAHYGGSIINIGSIASHIGLKDRFAYSISKGAVLTATLSVATDFVKQGIRCNCISPARVHTPFVEGFISKHYPGDEAAVFKRLSDYQPCGRMGKPEEVASMALFLASDESRFVTGANLQVDGGVGARM